MLLACNQKKNEDYYKNSTLSHWCKNFDYKENDGGKNFSCKAKAPVSCILMRRTWLSCWITKNEDYYENLGLSHLMHELWIYGNYGKKLFLPNQSIGIMYPNEENMIVVPNHKKNEYYYENISLSHWRMNFDYNENGRKKNFYCQTIVPISCTQKGERDCSP